MNQEIRDILAHLGERDKQYPSVYHYSVIEFAGRFYPCRIDLNMTGDKRQPTSVNLLYWQWQEIPFAIGPRHGPGLVSFAKRTLAEDYGLRDEQEFTVLWDCSHITSLSEEFPERNAWYLEEIARLIVQHAQGYRTSSRGLVHFTYISRCEATIWLHTKWYWPQPLPDIQLEGRGTTMDEAIEQLYQRCYEQWRADEVTEQLAQHYANWIEDMPPQPAATH